MCKIQLEIDVARDRQVTCERMITDLFHSAVQRYHKMGLESCCSLERKLLYSSAVPAAKSVVKRSNLV